MVAGFVHGMIRGAIQEIASVVAIVAGVFVAGRVAAGTVSVTGQLSHPTAGKIFAFVITFIVVAILVSLAGKMVSNVAKKSGFSSVDRFVGGLFGACLMGLLAGLVLRLMALGGLESAAVAGSKLAPKLTAAVSYFTQFLRRGGAEVVACAGLVCVWRERTARDS